jgi:hypothetical protein
MRKKKYFEAKYPQNSEITSNPVQEDQALTKGLALSS